MKVIVAGSRDFNNCRLVGKIIEHAQRAWGQPITEIVSGNASGVDQAGEQWARIHNVPVKRFLPDWDVYGKGAGPMRNRAMADYGDRLVLIWDGKSPGSASMRREMLSAGKLHIWEHIVGVTEI